MIIAAGASASDPHPTKSPLSTSLKVGLFLAIREIRRGNIWATLLIIAVMVLTFLNLIVVSGVLIGLIQASVDANRVRYTGDILISAFKDESYIQHSTDIEQTLDSMPEVQVISPRYTEDGQVEANYKESRKPSQLANTAGGLITGIDPLSESQVTGLGSKLVEGSYLAPDDYDMILIGANLLTKYTPIESPGLTTLRNVQAGSKVRLTVNGVQREVTIKGVLKTKVGEIDQRIFMPEKQFRQLIGRTDLNVGEIAVKLKDPSYAQEVVDSLDAQGFGQYAAIQTWQDAQPKFLQDIKATFAILANMISSIGLVVAAITIFIVIFVNAITRRRSIGILKGIGISATAIEFSYVLQALFYAVVGMAIGSLFVFGFLKPYIDLHPINFPFSDGILVADLSGTLIRVGILMVATIIAGFIPARIVVNQNTLDAILGR